MCSADKNLDFSDLKVGDVFIHRGTNYRKINKDSATVLGAETDDTVHRFYPEDPVTLVDKDSLDRD